MKKETLKRLQSADHPLYCTGPPDCDWKEIVERVRQLKPEVEELSSRLLLMEEDMQDATYLAGLYSEDRDLCIRFSAWGQFFTIWDEAPECPLTPEELGSVVTLIEKRGFKYVNINDLGKMYDGSNEYFKQEKWPRFKHGKLYKEAARWWDRYFDYLC